MPRKDERLHIYEPSRADVSDRLGDTPVASIAWRAMRREHERRRKAEQGSEGKIIALADDLFRLKKTAQTSEPRNEGESGILALMNHIERGLSALGLAVICSEGVPYSDELMEVLDNVSQVSKPGIPQPEVAEVIVPGILYRGNLLRMGKAVIALPVRKSDE